MDQEKISQRLKIAGVANFGMGVGLALGALPALNLPAMIFADLVIWPINGAETGTDPVARLMMAISGGLIAGLGALWFKAAGKALKQAPEVVRSLLMTTALTWFVVDSVGSVLAAAPANVLGNIPFLALLLWPIWKIDVR